MHKVLTVLFAFGLTVAVAASDVEELTGLSLSSAQPVQTGDVTATGRIVTRSCAAIAPRVSGHIVQWGADAAGQPLEVGMKVRAGQTLFVVDQSIIRLKVDAAQAALESAQAALLDLKAPTRKERVDVLRFAIEDLEARLKNSAKDLARYSHMVEVDHTATPKKLEEVQLDHELLRVQRGSAQAQLDEALAGATVTAIAVSEARVKEARIALALAQQDLTDTEVKAPFDGVIISRSKGLGDFVGSSPFVEVLQLTTLEALEAELNLPEAYFSKIVPERTAVALQSPVLPSELNLPVTRIIPSVDAKRGTFAFRVAIPPAQQGRLSSGAFVSAALRLGGEDEGVIVPQHAVVADAGHNCVFVSDGKTMTRREVTLSTRLTEGVIVRSGLKAGEQVVVGLLKAPPTGTPLPAYLASVK